MIDFIIILLCILIVPFALCALIFTGALLIGLLKGIAKAITNKKKAKEI